MLLALTPDSAGAPSLSVRSHAVGSEGAVYAAIRAGDERQASQVYAQLLPAVQATLLRVLGSWHQNHRDLTRRSIEQVIVELSGHANPGVCALTAWAATSAARIALDVLRARARTRDVEFAWGETSHDDRRADAARAVAQGSAIDRLRWLLAELPHQQAEAVVLCDVMGLDPTDVAVTLGVRIERLGRLLSAGHARLSRLLSTPATS